MKMISFQVDRAPTFKTSCKTCHLLIQKSEIRIVQKVYCASTKYYHLPCFTPDLNQYIRKRDLKLKLDESSEKVFDEWLSQWNSQQFSLDKVSRIDHPLIKTISTLDTPKKRALLEIFKFLTVNDLLQNLTLVNKEFYHVTWNQELWKFLYVRDFFHEIISDNWKLSYLNAIKAACFGCHRVTNEEQPYICPQLKKILCQNCKNSDEFKMIIKSDIMTYCAISPELLNINYGKGYASTKPVYKKFLNHAILEFREKNKNILCDYLVKKFGQKSNIVTYIKNFDLQPNNLTRPIKNEDELYLVNTYHLIFEMIFFGKKMKFMGKIMEYGQD